MSRKENSTLGRIFAGETFSFIFSSHNVGQKDETLYKESISCLRCSNILEPCPIVLDKHKIMDSISLWSLTRR